jgi:hypothetical protein
MFRQDGSCPALLADLRSGFPYGAVTRSGPPFQALRVPKAQATGLFRVRSPLLTESPGGCSRNHREPCLRKTLLMSVPPATEMFQFAGFASCTYEFSTGYPCGWVAPFGDPGITDRSHLPRAFRSVPRPSSPLSAKASTRCPSLALDVHHTAAHRGKTPFPRPWGRSPRAKRGPRCAKRPRMKTLLGQASRRRREAYPPRSHDKLSLHPSINSRRAGRSRAVSLASPNADRAAFGVARATPIASSQRCCDRGGGERIRTDDLLLAKQALSQLSYTPGQRSEIRKQRSGSDL